MLRGAIIAAFSASCLTIAGCGVQVPKLEEPWESREIGLNLITAIKKNILCELVTAVQYVNGRTFNLQKTGPILGNYGVQFQLDLTTDESTELNPGLTYTRTFLHGLVYDNPVGQSFSMSLGGKARSAATALRTVYEYYDLDRIALNDPAAICNEQGRHAGSSLLLQSELGIRDFLIGATRSSTLYRSSEAPAKGEFKRGYFVYNTKFVVETTGNVTPTWKLVAISGDGSPFLSTNRTRTHELTLTFSSHDPGTLRGPNAVAVQAHFTTQLKAALDRFNTSR
ncbi:hypothetical protein [Enterovirga aerilata]|uniref:Lipoprotein n=1 Tax=Enterovirga aerilata TaxID=2730920 RepID=A0A849I8V7_9HYPH|nr:hypothetical protein [Enterovirga sp. DB1703]NNM74234.1 hypothetical protein [Enterovirga sp. DB1703]